MAWWGSRISSRVPHPCDGRCWKSPSESRSPYSRLRRSDSWYAAASAIVAARAGSPRRTEIAAMSAALPDCSRSSSTVRPAASARHSSTSGKNGGREPSCHVTNAAAPPNASAEMTRTVSRRRVTRTSVAVQRGVQLDPAGLPRHRLDRAGHRVAAEQDVVGAGQLHRLHDGAVGEGDLGAGRHVAAGLDDAVVTEGDADAGVGAQQAALADGDDLL